MVRYRNVRHGSIVERHAADEWLEASAGWERIDEPTPELELEEDDVVAVEATPLDDDNERTDDR